MAKRFPEFMFVAFRNEGEDDEYFECAKDHRNVIEDDGPTRVATYQLVHVAEVSKQIVVRKIGRKRGG